MVGGGLSSYVYPIFTYTESHKRHLPPASCLLLLPPAPPTATHTPLSLVIFFEPPHSHPLCGSITQREKGAAWGG